MLDIENYCDKNDHSFVFQNVISTAAYGIRHKPEIGNSHFASLIESYKEKGFDINSVFTIDKDFRLVDGNHRMGMNLYNNIDKIKVRILNRKVKNPKSIDWYLKIGIDSDIIKKVHEKYKEVSDRLFERGSVFCLILPNRRTAEDVIYLSKSYILNTFSGISDNIRWGGYSFLIVE